MWHKRKFGLLNCLVLIFMMPFWLHSVATLIKEGDENFKSVKLSVKIENSKDKSKYSVTVKIGQLMLEGNQLSYLHLMSDVRFMKENSVRFYDMKTIEPKIINGEAVFEFEVNKDELNIVDFCYFKNREPLVRYEVQLNDFYPKIKK